MLLGLLVLVTCLYSLLARDTYGSDFRSYYDAAQASHDGLAPYVNQVNVDERYADRDWLQANSRFIYPPSSLLFNPFARLPYRVAKVAFGTLMALIMAGLLFRLSASYPQANWIALGLFLSLPMASNIDNGQVDVLILALTLAAFYARRSWLGGTCLGVAIAIKLAPVLVVLWLLTRRRWPVALWSAGSSLVLTLLGIWGWPMYREFLAHLRAHLGANPPMLTHTFTTVAVLYGRFVVMGNNTYSLHYFFGTRQDPLLALGSLAGAVGLAAVAAYLLWSLSPRGRALTADASFFGFLVVALLANTLLWPAGLVACFPLTLLLVQRSRTPAAHGFAMLTPLFLPVEFFANRRFLFWLLAAGWCVWQQSKRQDRLAAEFQPAPR